MYLLGLGNSVVGNEILKILNSTINYQVENILQIPIIMNKKNEVVELVKENIELMKNEYDKHEYSWNFKQNEIIKINNKKISEAVNMIIDENNIKREKLKENEEKLNKIFL
jgi:hypothetical protein